MLSQKLRSFVRDGLVTRTVSPTVPPRVIYALTALGEDLTLQLCELVSWIGKITDEIVRALEGHDSPTMRTWSVI
jgi:DNA-binding HxlR family transcriptional regulator